MKPVLAVYILTLLFPATANAQLKLPSVIRDSMVLQRDMKLKIWGWATPGEKIRLRFNGKSISTITDKQGKWLTIFPPMKAGGPYRMEIKGKTTITLQDILIGDVWLCSGQSNMLHQLRLHNITYATDIAQANYPQIRHFNIAATTNLVGPQDSLPNGYWHWANPKDVTEFSAVAYFFARQIYQRYHVPIGLINASVGGTPIEAWTSEEGLQDFPSVVTTIQKNKDTAFINRTNQNVLNKNREELITDKGLAGPIKWYDTAYVPKGWQTITIPGYWEDQGARNLDGVVWYRREIDVPAAMTGAPATVFLGRIVDADFLYINGALVGQTSYQYPQRRYNVSAGVLKPGKNSFVIRVVNTAGKGGFVPAKPYYIEAAGQTLDLKGYWQYKVGEAYAPPDSSTVQNGIIPQNQPTALYNAMVAPITNVALKGILWYQGESNVTNAQQYQQLLPALIKDWRSKWGTSTLPFLYVQLPNFGDADYLPAQSDWAVLREAALKTLAVPYTGMAVTIDLGEWNDIHPDNKKDVGERLALAARTVAYGEKALVSSGPLYTSSKIDGNKISISFENVGSGLVSIDGEELFQFAIAGADKKFVWAHAKIVGTSVEVWNDAIAQPLFVRYAWADNPFGANLYNKEGLPASPFRTDD